LRAGQVCVAPCLCRDLIGVVVSIIALVGLRAAECGDVRLAIDALRMLANFHCLVAIQLATALSEGCIFLKIQLLRSRKKLIN